MRPTLLSVLVLCASPLLAPAQSRPGVTVPYILRFGFGNWSTGYPFAEAPIRFQQLILGSELGGALDISGIQLRKDNTVGSAPGHTIDVEIRLAHTTKTPATLSTSFAANFDSGLPDVVRARRSLALIAMANAAPSGPDDFFSEIQFDKEFPFRAQGRNLLLEVAVYGNDNGNLRFAYPLDSGTNTTGATLIGPGGPTASAGLVTRGDGIALRMLTPPGRCAAFSHMFNGSGPTGRTGNTLTGGNPPLIGTTCTMDLNAPTYDFAAMLLSLRTTHQVTIPMPGYRVPIYVDPTAVVTLPLGLQSGYAGVQLPVPNFPVWKGLDLAFQGVMASNARPDLLGATNLVLANLGTSLLGSATFAMVQGPFTIKPIDWLKTPDDKEKLVVHQAGMESADKIEIQGTKSGGQELVIVVESSAGLREYPIQAAATTFSQTVDVPANGRVYFKNTDQSNSIAGLTYEVTIIR